MAIDVGDRVINARFGSGTVVAVDETKLTIQFDSGTQRHILCAFAIHWGDVEVKLSGALGVLHAYQQPQGQGGGGRAT
jgi:hypothetical protein